MYRHINECVHIIYIYIYGRTNAVLLMDAISGDDSDQVLQSLTTNLSAAALAQVQFVRVDNPSYKSWQALRTVSPNLQVMTLDPTHLHSSTPPAEKGHQAPKPFRVCCKSFLPSIYIYICIGFRAGITIMENTEKRTFEMHEIRG